MENTEITVQFPDEERVTYSLPMDSTVSDLISAIKNDSRISIPENSQISIMFLGHFLKESMLIKEIDNDSEFVVSCIFRAQKKFYSSMEITEEEEENSNSSPSYGGFEYTDENELVSYEISDDEDEEDHEESPKGWSPFIVGTIIGMLFGYHWLMFLLLIYPNILLFIGYAFGAGLVISVKNCMFL